MDHLNLMASVVYNLHRGGVYIFSDWPFISIRARLRERGYQDILGPFKSFCPLRFVKSLLKKEGEVC